MKKIKTYIINLAERTDRRDHILTEFALREEFEITVVSAIRDNIGSWGLWKTFKSIIENAKIAGEKYILICEDDHTFTKDYNKEKFIKIIDKLAHHKIDLLLGGASWFDMALPISADLFWVKLFNGLQFTVIFQDFFDKILTLNMERGKDLDIEMSVISDKCFLCFPYISTQKEFGYSDITPSNKSKGHVTSLFVKRMEKLKQLHKIANYYNRI